MKTSLCKISEYYTRKAIHYTNTEKVLVEHVQEKPRQCYVNQIILKLLSVNLIINNILAQSTESFVMLYLVLI